MLLVVWVFRKQLTRSGVILTLNYQQNII